MTVENNLALLEIINPPVNALSNEVRLRLANCISNAATDPDVQAIVLFGGGKTFIAGADIREFDQPLQVPLLPDLINDIEAVAKPVIAALHGVALGGGLELALGVHYRVALPTTKFGLPEVNIGLIPGAGATQRLPRLIPVAKALQMITSGKPIMADEALDIGLIDKLDDRNDSRAAGIAFATELLAAGKTPRRASQLPCHSADEEMFAAVRAQTAKSARHQIAPQKAIDAVQNALHKPFVAALAIEQAYFKQLMAAAQSKAMIHAFFAERQVSRLPQLNGVEPRAIDNIGIIGGGTMGAGITGNALLAGLHVTLLERDAESAECAKTTVMTLLSGALKRGKLPAEQFRLIRAEKFRTTVEYAALSNADLVIEAVFENLAVKQDVFNKLDAVCKPGAILASNTSYLNLNTIAAMTQRPQDVVGLHFFSPAHIMRLLEVVVGDKTSDDVVASGFALSKRLGKVAVRAGVCDGFIGNRILAHYRKAIDGAVLAGASPFAVDKALVNFGLAMGPFTVGDLAGLDIGWANRKRLAPSRNPHEQYAEFADRLCEQGHFGRKTGRGFYIYAEGSNKTEPNPEVETLIAAERAAKGISARNIDEQEIIERYMAAMVNEAARVIGDGIAQRPLDVDVTLLNGYGFPRWRGGPMHYADAVGLEKILADIQRFKAEDDCLWQPAPLLVELAAKGWKFVDLNAS